MRTPSPVTDVIEELIDDAITDSPTMQEEVRRRLQKSLAAGVFKN